MTRNLSLLTSSLAALAVLAAGPALASDRAGNGGHPGGGHPGGGYGGGHPGGGHPGGNVNINVNASATANASAYAGAGAGGFINARGYDVRSVSDGYGAGHGGMVAVGSGGVDLGGYGQGGYGYVYVSGPGYGPSRPFGYRVAGFGRRYVTTDRCGGCDLPPGPPPQPCRDRCDTGHGYDGGHGYQGGYGRSGASGSSYSVRESYSESSAYSGGHAENHGGGYADYPPAPPEHRSYAPPPTTGHDYGYAAPAEPVYAPPQVYYEPATAPSQGYAMPQPQVYQPAPVHIAPPAGYYGDLPPGDTGEGRPYRQEMPYRQEYGERG